MTWHDEAETMPVPLAPFAARRSNYEGTSVLRALARHADAERKRMLLRKRGNPLARENYPPRGHAALWYEDVIRFVPRSGQHVARAIARLAGDDSVVNVSYRSLADAVGQIDKLGRDSAYARRGVNTLVEAGWLAVETVGAKRGAVTTFYLIPGDLDGIESTSDEWVEMDSGTVA